MAGPFKMKGSPMQRNYGIASPAQKTTSYSEAYKTADQEKYKTEADFTKAAKAYNTEKYATTEPTREANKLVGQYEGNMTNANKVTKKTAKKELENRNTTKKTNANSLDASKKANADGLKSGKYIKKNLVGTNIYDTTGDGVKVVNKSNVSSKRKVSVEEARGRGKDSVKANRKAFGRGSAEVKAAKKAKRESVRTAKKNRREAKNK